MNNDNNNLNNLFRSSLFAQTPQKENKQPSFGATTQQFGAASGSSQPFGSNIFQPTNTGNFSAEKQFILPTNQPTSNTGNVFGSQQTSNFGSNAFSGSSGFNQGVSTSNNVFNPSVGISGTQGTGFGTTFGQSNSNSLPTFGTSTNQNASTLQSGNPFIKTNSGISSSTSNSNIFGISTPQSQFGQLGSSTAVPFKQEQSGWNSSDSSVFGNSSSVFGATQQTSSLGNTFQSKNGTKNYQYKPQKLREERSFVDSEFTHINSMKEYADKSSDELRYEDYCLGRVPIKNQASVVSQQPSNVFGALPSSSQSTFSSIGNSFTPSENQQQPFSSLEQKTEQPAPVNLFKGGSLSNVFGQPPTSTPFQNITAPPSSVFSPPQQTAPQNVQSLSSSFCSPQSSFFPENSFVQNTAAMSSNLVEPNRSVVQQTSFQQPSFQTTSAIIDNSDPFLLKNIKFEKIKKIKTPFTKILLEPVFLDDTKSCPVSLKYRAPKQVVKKAVYTIPAYEEVRYLREVDNLIIGFENRGRIEYLDKVLVKDITIKNIENKILFNRNFITVNDPPGMGLNKRARVYIEGVYPYSKSEGDFIVGKATKFPLKGIQERFVYSLREDPYRKFIDYEYDKGLYVYEVNHF